MVEYDIPTQKRVEYQEHFLPGIFLWVSDLNDQFKSLPGGSTDVKLK